METRNVETNRSHNYHIFIGMVEMLIESGLDKKCYEFDASKNRFAKIRYEDIATVMNREGFSNSRGQPLTGSSVRKLIERIRTQENDSKWWNDQKPSWEWFHSSQEQKNDTTFGMV